MAFLRVNWGWLVSAVVILACGYWVYAGLASTSESQQVSDKMSGMILVMRDKINRPLLPPEMVAARDYSAEIREKLSMPGRLRMVASGRVVYPRLSVPEISVRTITPIKVPIPPANGEPEYAELQPPANLQAQPTHGPVYLGFDPAGVKHMTVVRYELWRRKVGAAGPEQPLHTFEVAPEEPSPGTGPEKVEPKKEKPDEGLRRREDQSKPAGEGEEEKPQAALRLETKYSYVDGKVQEKTTYLYQVRALACFSPPKNEVGAPTEKSKEVLPPRNLEKIKAPRGDVDWYLSPFASVQVTTLASLEFRLRMLSRKEIEDPFQPGKKKLVVVGHFEVRLWDGNLGEWLRDIVEVQEGEPLAGVLKYRHPKTGRRESRNFDTGSIFVGTSKSPVTGKKKKEELKLDADGNPVRDKEGNFLYEWIEIEVLIKVVDVAVMRDRGGGEKKLPIGGEFGEEFTGKGALDKPPSSLPGAAEAPGEVRSE